MKYLLAFSLIVHLNVQAQVPPREVETYDDVKMVVAEPPSEENQSASYYVENNKYGFVYPQRVKQEAIYDKITSTSIGFIVIKNGLFGVADKKGVVLGRIEYDSIESNNKVFIIKKKGKYGSMSKDGRIILPAQFNKILYTDDQNSISFVDTKDGVQMIFNDQLKPIQQKIDAAQLYLNLVVVKANGKYGVMKEDKIVVPFIYDSIFVTEPGHNQTYGKGKVSTPQFSFFTSSRQLGYFTVLKDGKYGLMNNDGSEIFPADNDAVFNLSITGYYSVQKGKLFGIYFIGSKTKTEVEFDKVYADGYGYIMAVKNGKSGVFSLKGEQITPFEYDNDFISQYSGIGLRVSKNKKRGIISKTGEIIIPTIYDDLSPFSETGLRDFIKVKIGEKFGIVNMKGEEILPVEFSWIGDKNRMFMVETPEPNRRYGLYNSNGKVVVPAEYKWITKSATEDSKLTILIKNDSAYNFLNKDLQMIFSEDIIEYGYLHNQDNLLNPFGDAGLYVKDKNGKVGMLSEITEKLNIPMIYDQIFQFTTDKHIYYSVQKGKKFGLINEKNEVVIPIVYNAIDIDLTEAIDNNMHAVVRKGKKFGVVDLQNQVVVPFQYTELKRVSSNGIYKAKKKNQFQLINYKNSLLNDASFDEVANFEQSEGFEYGETPAFQALTFLNGKMRVINDKGVFVTEEVAMQPHKGFKTFDELKLALVRAFDSKDIALLKEFVEKVAPSDHIIFYLKNNPFGKGSLEYINFDEAKQTCFEELRQFMLHKWREDAGYGYDPSTLTDVTDFTLYREGYVTNRRNAHHAYGDTRFLEKLLRNAVKINGYWISTYFMRRR